MHGSSILRSDIQRNCKAPTRNHISIGGRGSHHAPLILKGSRLGERPHSLELPFPSLTSILSNGKYMPEVSSCREPYPLVDTVVN